MPLSLNVYEDNNARNNERRFNLNADDDPSNAAPVVVGVRNVEAQVLATLKHCVRDATGTEIQARKEAILEGYANTIVRLVRGG